MPRPRVRIVVPRYPPELSDRQLYAAEEARGVPSGLKIKEGEKIPEPLRAIRDNSKTLRSFECTTLCPKHLRGIACTYCYVQAAIQRHFDDPAACAQTAYRGLGMNQKTIDELNRRGGLRLFSFADYIDTPQCDRKIEELNREAKSRGLLLKAVTKRTDFVEKHHDKMDVVNVSVDSIGSGVRWKEAQRLREKYPNVMVRSVVANQDEIEEWGNRDWVDIITPYHNGVINYKLDRSDPYALREYEERRREGEGVKDSVTFRDMDSKKNPEVANRLSKYYNKVCCLGGKKCGECGIVCGLPKARSRQIP